MHRMPRGTFWLMLILAVWVTTAPVWGQKKPTRDQPAKTFVNDADLAFPPTLPDGKTIVTDTSPEFLKRPETIADDVDVATMPPTVDFLFYPQQDYLGKPWSNWGDGCFANGKYYSAIGDHFAIGRGDQQQSTGTAFVYEYDPAQHELKTLVDVAKLLALPEGHYTPGKIHSRVDMASDGWLYYATHRGSPKAANDENHYEGDWIFRTNPKTSESEIVVQGPVPKHSIPNSVVDPKRMIFYGATAAGPDAPLQEIQFFAYDLKHRKMLYSGPDGPARYMILAQSTGCLYFVPGNSDGELMRFDPEKNTPPIKIGQSIGVRAATQETAAGLVYSVSTGQKSGDATLWEFNTKTEKSREIGTIAVGTEAYVASIDVDPTGRYLYYVPGAHGGGYRDGSPLVQYDINTGKKKVIAFLHPFYEQKYGFIPKGTYSTAVSNDGAKVFITWNISRGTKAWDCCGLTIVHIPAEERTP